MIETETETPHNVHEIDESIFANERFKNDGSLESSLPRSRFPMEQLLFSMATKAA